VAKGRLLNEVVILSKKINTVSEGAENLYYRLLICVDDYGRYHAEPEIIKGKALTLRKVQSKEIKKRLKELWEVNLIKVYRDNGEIYLEIVDFGKHQKFRSDIKRREDFPKPVTYLKHFVTDCNDSERMVEAPSSSTNRNNNRNNNKNGNGNKERKRVIDYFNEITGQKRTHVCDETNKLVNGRLSEGRAFKDFKHVIDTKTAQWQKDSKMKKYLRPSTLFAPGNFEDYLNEDYEDPKKKVPVGVNPKKPDSPIDISIMAGVYKICDKKGIDKEQFYDKAKKAYPIIKTTWEQSDKKPATFVRLVEEVR